jgi:hypothetical protein
VVEESRVCRNTSKGASRPNGIRRMRLAKPRSQHDIANEASDANSALESLDKIARGAQCAAGGAVCGEIASVARTRAVICGSGGDQFPLTFGYRPSAGENRRGLFRRDMSGHCSFAVGIMFF